LSLSLSISGAVAHIPGANIKEFLVTILDGLVKSHSASLGSNP
jgi:hypothetical protein